VLENIWHCRALFSNKFLDEDKMQKLPFVRSAILLTSFALAGCVVETPPPRVVYVRPAPPPAPHAVVSVYVDPPMHQPEPIAVAWAPPPLLVETLPPPPFEDAVWVGGYWVWHGDWVWAHGHWIEPPHPGYTWVQPYYEHRDGEVIFVDGFWAEPGVRFMPPPVGIHISVAIAAVGVVPGPRPIGPAGVFVPPPPGSRAGIIVPAPIGTPPAVVTSAPPVVNVGMHITSNHINNVTNVTNITNVTVVAPPSATASGRGFNGNIPAQAHLAAALPPVVKTSMAPADASVRPVPSFVPGHTAPVLPTDRHADRMDSRQGQVMPDSHGAHDQMDTRDQGDQGDRRDNHAQREGSDPRDQGEPHGRHDVREAPSPQSQTPTGGIGNGERQAGKPYANHGQSGPSANPQDHQARQTAHTDREREKERASRHKRRDEEEPR